MTGRRVFETTYGYIGISVDSKDRRIIAGVDSDSPAERSGLKAGDKLLTVNQKKVSKSSPKCISDIFVVPYFKYVFSSRGNKSIFLLVESAERKKKYEVEVTPIVNSQQWFLK